MRSLRAIGLALCLAACHTTLAADNLISGGDFEGPQASSPPEGWHRFWSRSGGGRAVHDDKTAHGGRRSARVEYPGSEDWSFAQQKRLDVTPGRIYELSGWVRVEGQGEATLSVVLYDAQGQAISWSYGGRSARATADWRELRSRFVIPPGTRQIQARLMGHGPVTAWLDDVSLQLAGNLDDLRGKELPKTLKAENATMEVTLDATDATLAVLDRRAQRRWTQRAAERGVLLLDAKAADRGFDLRLLDAADMLPIQAAIRLDKDRPEMTVELLADRETSVAFRSAEDRGPRGAESDDLAGRLAWPHPFATDQGDLLIVPVNEGISYPADDASLRPMYYHLYGGHGLCMGFWGVTDALARRAMMAIVETPDDAAVSIPRLDGRLHLAPQWLGQKGKFGPPRRLRYCFFESGGYVALCKRYRQHAREAGLLKTLAEKRKENPNVDLLVGAVNVWCWDKDPVRTCRELQEAGIGRILWSNQATPEQIEAMNGLGVLTSRYDIYQDVMDPANFPKLRGVHSDWTTEAWPKDLLIQADGRWERGWQVRAKDGSMLPCGVLCDRQAVEYARRRIPEDLKTRPYRCRFIDTTTASPWRECYAPGHPMTRSESRQFKMDLLEYVSRDGKLVTGSETGHEAAVPYVHYFEGMLSLGPYRVSDSGRDMQRIVEEVPEQIAKFQTGHFYRLPLWELVYHDCVVAQWYWGDYNNKLPAVWDRRDLWNALYGTPPMFMFSRPLWEKDRGRFARSYKTACPVARATGYREMLSHRWLTEDRAVQETRFAGGVTVTANFGAKPFAMPDGTPLAPLGLVVEGLPP